MAGYLQQEPRVDGDLESKNMRFSCSKHTTNRSTFWLYLLFRAATELHSPRKTPLGLSTVAWNYHHASEVLVPYMGLVSYSIMKDCIMLIRRPDNAASELDQLKPNMLPILTLGSHAAIPSTIMCRKLADESHQARKVLAKLDYLVIFGISAERVHYIAK